MAACMVRRERRRRRSLFPLMKHTGDFRDEWVAEKTGIAIIFLGCLVALLIFIWAWQLLPAA